MDINRSQKITNTFTAIMAVVNVLYMMGYFHNVPCDHSFISSFERNFIHVSPFHFLANTYAFYQFSPIESILGVSGYITLIIGLAFVETMLEIILSYFFDMRCSIGFSGVLYGLITWIILSHKGATDMKMLIGIILSIITSSSVDPQLSLAGHLLGVVSGVIMSFVPLR